MNYEKVEITPVQLLLDPNNYRFHDIRGYKAVRQKGRYQEPGVQDRALTLLRETTAFDLESLRDSIRTNGYIPVEQIVFVPFDSEEEGTFYLVIEGNRRAASLKTLLDDYEAGAVELSGEVKASIEKISVVVLVGSDEEIRILDQRTLMAIRHVAGIREWGPYQQAKLVVEMFEEQGATLGAVAQKIGISSREVARRYRQGETVVTETAAICAYLADAFPEAGRPAAQQSAARRRSRAHSVTEADRRSPIMIDTPRITQVAAQRTAVIGLTVPRKEIRNVMGPGIGELRAAIAAQSIAPTGHGSRTTCGWTRRFLTSRSACRSRRRSPPWAGSRRVTCRPRRWHGRSSTGPTKASPPPGARSMRGAVPRDEWGEGDQHAAKTDRRLTPTRS